MPLSLRFEPEAVHDLADIAEWVSLKADDATARQYVGRILARCRKLLDNPRGGRLRRRSRPQIRSVPFERSGLILYRVGRSELIVIRILRRGLDPDLVLRQR